MESQPAPGGVTVFGTRLTYRQAAIGAGIVLLVLVLLITLIAQAVGGEDKTGGTEPNAVGTTGATATTPTTQSTQPSVAATTPSAAPSSAAPTTTAPSSAPATDDGAGSLPAGWALRTFAASGSAPAFKLPLPADADVSGSGTEMRMRWNNRLLILGRTKSPQADAYEDWQNQEKARRGTYRNYSLISLKRVSYRNFESAADWEFTYTTDSGNPQHVMRRNIRVNGSAAYSLNWYVSTSDWDASQADLKALYQGFQPQ
ncbi:hypothetical protein [Paractinoplanes toevensis]|nr:hypothetical protein [Actinoplanes toevensis]